MWFKKLLEDTKNKYDETQEKNYIVWVKKLLEDTKNKYDETQEKNHQEKLELKSHQKKVNNLLDEFTIPQFDDFLKNYLGKIVSVKYYENKSGKKIAELPIRGDYVQFIYKQLNNNEITYNQLKKYALKQKLVSPSFFSHDEENKYDENDFKKIIDSIKNNFKPEKIKDEEHLESQLVIYLKTKFPDKKISRQVIIQGNDVLDILIDDKYALELKVPSERSHLRNLGAQLVEYNEHYPDICAIIFDNVNEPHLTQDIIDYSDKFKRNHAIPTIILNGMKR